LEVTVEEARSGFSVQRLERLRAWMQGYVARGELPCASVLVNQRGATVFRDECGWQDLEILAPLQPGAIFRIMSMTKPITALAALLLYEEGAFDLNTPISRFLPAFKEMKVLKGKKVDGSPDLEDAASPITFRHLFTHTSGLSYAFDPNDAVDHLYLEKLAPYYNPLEASYSLRESIESLAGLPLAFHPGTSWRYGLNLDVLALLVETISGKPYPEFLQGRIFKPLGMVDTSFILPESKQDRLVVLYTRDEDNGQLRRRDIPSPLPMILWGGGGLYSTIDDYARFAGMLANHGELDGLRLLSPSSAAMFSMNWASEQAMGDYNKGTPEAKGGFGYSLGTSVLLNPSAIGIYGNPGEFTWGGAFSTYFWIDPREGLFGIFMTQFDLNDYYPINKQFHQLVYQALIED
jgi:CubicO group peptidase (beta-lactamase class C family)